MEKKNHKPEEKLFGEYIKNLGNSPNKFSIKTIKSQESEPKISRV